MPNYYPIIEKTLYVLSGSNVARTGILLYYDPLLFSDISGSILSGLNSTSSSTVPSSDSITSLTLPDQINCNLLNVTITTSTG